MPPAKSGEAAPAQVDRFGGGSRETKTRGTQVSGRFDPRDRVRRELFTLLRLVDSSAAT